MLWTLDLALELLEDASWFQCNFLCWNVAPHLAYRWSLEGEACFRKEKYMTDLDFHFPCLHYHRLHAGGGTFSSPEAWCSFKPENKVDLGFKRSHPAVSEGWLSSPGAFLFLPLRPWDKNTHILKPITFLYCKERLNNIQGNCSVQFSFILCSKSLKVVIRIQCSRYY